MNADTQGICASLLRLGPRSAGVARVMVLVLLTWLPQVLGQGYHARNWHMEDGLPDGQVTAIEQTPDGYLWIGTPRGLARFDGVRFKVFNTESTPGLGDSRITKLLTDRDGTLWIGTRDGNLVRKQGDRFEPVEPQVPLPVDANKNRIPGSWSWNIRSDLIADGEGAIWWYVTGKGIARFKSGKWTVFTATNGLPGEVSQMACDHEGYVWVEAGSKLYRYESGRWSLPEQAVPLSGVLTALAPAASGGLWVAEPQLLGSPSVGAVHRLAGRRWAAPTLSPPPRHRTKVTNITLLLEDRSGRLWLGMPGGGLWHSDLEGQWRSLEGQGSLARPFLMCLFEDRQGNIWVGTNLNGLYRLTPQRLTMLSPFGPNQRVLTVCATRDGTVWAGTDVAGIFRRGQEGFTPVGGEWGDRLPEVICLFEDTQTNLWAGTSDGLFWLEAGRFRRAPGPLRQNISVTSIFEDRAGSLWFGTGSDLFARENTKFNAYPVGAEIRSIVEDPAGDLLIGTIGKGLFELPPGQPRTLRRVENYPASDCGGMFCDPDGTLWVGSWGGGMFWRDGDVFKTITASDGLPSDLIRSIISDMEGKLWMASGNGIIGMAPRLIKAYTRGQSPPLFWQHFSIAQGLGDRVCTGRGQPTVAQTSDGRLWFPNEGQIAVLDPAKTGSRQVISGARVESVVVDGKELPFTAKEVLRLPSGTRRFEFHYTALDLTAPTHLRFRYKLEGMDARWVEAGVQRTAPFSQLPPGDYRFRVMAGGSDGQWHEADEAMRLQVVPRAWERRWIQFLGTGLLVSLVGGSLNWRQRRQLRLKLERLEMEQRVENERRRIARDLHDEVGSRLTRISQLGDLMLKESQSPAWIKSQVGAITSGIRELLSAMDEIVWTINPKNDSLPKLIAFLSDYTETFVSPTGISHRLELDPNFPTLPVPAQSRHHLLLAVKEALSNAVRHAAPKMVRLKLHASDGWLEVVIADDGQGFDLEKARAGGQGIANMVERLKLISGQAEVRSEVAKGTTVTLRMPLAARLEHN